MEKLKALTARKGISIATAVVLVLALLSSLFAFTLGRAEETSTTTTTKNPNQYTVKFDANGGYFDQKDKDGKNLTVVERTGLKGQGLDDKSQLVPLYEEDAYGTQAKYFEGWTATNDDKINVDPATYDPEKDITVKAVWTDKITVTFDDQQGNKTSYYFEKGDSLDVKSIPMPTPKDGEVFAGWYEDAATTTDALDYGVLKPTQSITYYAGYSEGATVKLVGNGGHYLIAKGVNKDKTTNYEYRTTKTVYVPKGRVLGDQSPDRNYPGKIFAGYYSDPEFAEDSKVESLDQITKDITLYAKWEEPKDPDQYYILTYKVFDEDAERYTDRYEVKLDIGEALTKDHLYAPEYKANTEFIGWYTDINLTNPAPKFDGSFVPDEDITLYAKYNDTVTINIHYWYANNNNEDVSIDVRPATYVSGVTDSRADIRSDYTKRFLDDSELEALGINPVENGISTIWYADKAHTKVVNGKADLTIDKDGNTNIYGVLVKRQAIELRTDAKIGGQIAKDGSVISADADKDAKYVTATAYVNNDSTLEDALDQFEVINIADNKLKDFVGWTEKEGDTTLVGDKKAKGVEVVYSVIDNAYIVTLDLNGGYDRGPTLSKDQTEVRKNKLEIRVANGKVLGTSTEFNEVNPRYYGDKVFVGWTTDAEGTKSIDPDEFTVTEDTTLYAQYTRFEEEPAEPAEPEEPAEALNGIVKGPDGKWALYKDNEVQTDYTGIAKNDYGWWRIENGYVNFDAQGIYRNEYGWWKTTDGKVTFDETGVFQNEYGWWRVVNSKVDFNAQEIYGNQYGWWKTTDGKVLFNENGIFRNQYGWWKVENSKVNFNFTGIASNEYGTWYVEKGKVNFNKNGKVTYNGATYNVTDGKAKLA